MSLRRSLFLLALCACARSPKSAEAPKAKPLEFPVQVAPVAAQRVEYALSAVGSVDAFERMPITARVPGAIERVLFTEGDTVKRGQVLVEIELERYLLAVKAAQAAMERSQA